MEAVEGARLTFGKRVAAFPIVIVALLIGNALGFVLATVSQPEGLELQGLKGAPIMAAQAGVGVYLAFLGCQRFLKDHRYASVWLVAYVALIGLAILFGALGQLFDRGLATGESWQMPLLVVNAAVIEIGRRVLIKLGVG